MGGFVFTLRGAYGACVLFLVLSVLSSCATSPQVPANAESPLPSSDAPLMVRQGDVLKVEFAYHPELNATQTVRADGKISLRLIDDIEVVGLRPEQIHQRLLEAYKVLKDPAITVVIQTDQRYVYVGGEVAIPAGQSPVRVQILGPMTPMEAILQAGGLKNASAKISNVLIIRRIGCTEYARTIDLRAAFRKGERESFLLEPGDIVFVPRAKIDRANQWVSQYMNKLVPEWVRFNLGYSYVRSNTTGSYSTTATPAGGG
jgi:polysaccharide biosynthesis/export protein